MSTGTPTPSIDEFIAILRAKGLDDLRLGEDQRDRDHRAQLTRALVAQQWVVACALEGVAKTATLAGPLLHEVMATSHQVGILHACQHIDAALSTPAELAARIMGEEP